MEKMLKMNETKTNPIKVGEIKIWVGGKFGEKV